MITLAIETNKMAAFVGSDSLTVDLLAADPAEVDALGLFAVDFAKFFHGNVMALTVASWTFNLAFLFFGFLLEFWCVFDCPE